MGFIRFRFILLGRKLILKEGKFLERKNRLYKIKTRTLSILKQSTSGDRNSILINI